jgi:prevent-host-death family protein
MAKAIRRRGVRRIPISEIKEDLSRLLREAEREEIVITATGNRPGC